MDVLIFTNLTEFTGIQRNGKLNKWTQTNPTEGNQWRKLSAGHWVLAFPIWLYCDNTSGNTSKKWNKHNSFLFTAAGLPRKFVHCESNIHFLSTSNIAPPLGHISCSTTAINSIDTVPDSLSTSAADTWLGCVLLDDRGYTCKSFQSVTFLELNSKTLRLNHISLSVGSTGDASASLSTFSGIYGASGSWRTFV